MKAPFVFKPRPSTLLTFLAAMFAAKNVERDIDPPLMNHQGASSGHPQHPGPRKHFLSKKERKLREHIRRINPNRKH
jgi:hypothetical protein